MARDLSLSRSVCAPTGTDAARMAVLKAVGDGEAAIELLVLTSDSDRDAYPYPGADADAGEAAFSRSRSLLGWGLRLGCVCSYVWLQSWARGMDTAQTLRLQLDAVASTPALIWKACSDCLSPAGAGCYRYAVCDSFCITIFKTRES